MSVESIKEELASIIANYMTKQRKLAVSTMRKLSAINRNNLTRNERARVTEEINRCMQLKNNNSPNVAKATAILLNELCVDEKGCKLMQRVVCALMERDRPVC